MTNNMTSSLQKEKGFTLIELIIVIIILGILAVTAAPKFIDIQSDARESVMQGVVGSIESANTLAHAKALIAGNTAAIGNNQTIAGETISFAEGYPTAATVGLLLDLDTAISTGTGTFFHTGGASSTTCTITVTNATSAGKPTLSTNFTGC